MIPRSASKREKVQRQYRGDLSYPFVPELLKVAAVVRGDDQVCTSAPRADIRPGFLRPGGLKAYPLPSSSFSSSCSFTAPYRLLLLPGGNLSSALCEAHTHVQHRSCCSCCCICSDRTTGSASGYRTMERFLGFVKQIRRSRRRKGKKYRPEEDYHEGYEDVYYYASEHLHSKCCNCAGC
ncbi:hypothetical protein KOW79_016242 [Hemibagrus wyckioides]|uniref:Uncharacterized protein n=1 Tax=Hemibagrus wyckioides TaxID=337641 RepID=A0A9D3SIJ6_9TELE|nr:hypothetical protein KOW79_016242 [Hemibagrus wyckioides]